MAISKQRPQVRDSYRPDQPSGIGARRRSDLASHGGRLWDVTVVFTRPRTATIRYPVPCHNGFFSHEIPPIRSILSASLRGRQSKIHRLQVGLHGSEPGLPWTTNPPSPVVRWARDAGLESSVMILSGVGAVEISKEGQTTAANSIRQKWLPSAGVYHVNW